MKRNTRETVHVCVTSHDEVMFRCHEDYARAFNCFANTVFDTETRALAEGFMSNHYHICIQTDDTDEFIYRMRFSYARYFNSKYHRKGRLGDRNPFTLRVEGVKHQTACTSYIFRQGLHHGICTTPFEYPYNSVNVIFQKELGKSSPESLMPFSQRRNYLPGKCVIPDAVRMDVNGQLLREDVIDCKYVQELFISPKNFLYYMTRPSDDSWVNEQIQEKKDDVITLDKIEKGTGDSSELLLKNEWGRVNYSHLTDLRLCEMIDNKYVPRFLKGDEEKSIYLIPDQKRAEMADVIIADLRNASKLQNRKLFVTDEQLKRCLILK